MSRAPVVAPTVAIVKRRSKRAARARAGVSARADIQTPRGTRAAIEIKVLAELDVGESLVRAFTDELTKGLFGR